MTYASLFVTDANNRAEKISMFAEYDDEVFEYKCSLERRLNPNPHYMDQQTEISWCMRSYQVQWLIEAHSRHMDIHRHMEFHDDMEYSPETLFLCVNYIDRFLSVKSISSGKLQLVGMTALCLAIEYEDGYSLPVRSVVDLIGGCHSIDEVLLAEGLMLETLQFDLGWPGPIGFLHRVSKAGNHDIGIDVLAKYFLEITLVDQFFVGYTSSFLAAASYCLAYLMLERGSWVGCATHHRGLFADLDLVVKTYPILWLYHARASRVFDGDNCMLQGPGEAPPYCLQEVQT